MVTPKRATGRSPARLTMTVIHAVQAWSVAAISDPAGSWPALQALLILLGTFILEDAATVLAAMRAQDGSISVPLALVALYAGIVLGDLGLYGMGRLAARAPWAARLIPAEARRGGQEWLGRRVVAVVFISRFVPGARLPTYTACGFLGADLRRFTLAAIGATLIWTTLLFGASLQVGALLLTYLGTWRWIGAAGFALALILIGRALARLHAWRP
jgi:membrane protein DedA with SNARE-associated domain